MEEEDNEFEQDIRHNLEILLHPRVPPLVRSLPHVESLSLFRAEESQEELDTREGLGLCGASPGQLNLVEDVVMQDFAPSETEQINNRQSAKVSEPPLPQNPSSSSFTNTSKNTLLAASTLLIPSTIEPSLSTPAETIVHPQIPLPHPIAALAQSDDDDEEMPVINLDSDSDDE
ncbi:hypothetical protein C0992_010466 [Termitomyces sp. T32_za158]|nr:hypothetical protein C0992_010466 [Termitomyces sp. T32_za158]